MHRIREPEGTNGHPGPICHNSVCENTKVERGQMTSKVTGWSGFHYGDYHWQWKHTVVIDLPYTQNGMISFGNEW